eukprot:m.55632 g.55632  ORF g.55632 m.55632 type:complete len:315 (-) comp6944_c1_seq1:1797-2741(-)
MAVLILSGPTCSGKTTIASYLHTPGLLSGRFHAFQTLHQDDYYYDYAEVPRLASGAADWDCVESVNFGRLAADIVELRANAPDFLVIVEGTMVLESDEIKALGDVLVHLDAPYELIVARRSNREYEYPEPDDYFDAHVWPRYMQLREAIDRYDDVHVVPYETLDLSVEHLAGLVAGILHSNVPSPLTRLLETLQPTVREGEYVYTCIQSIQELKGARFEALVQEDEGLTAVIARSTAEELGLEYMFVASWITLGVHSELEAVGLTKAVSTALTSRGISCNVLAAFHHDHLLVPASRCDDAVAALKALSAAAAQE